MKYYIVTQIWRSEPRDLKIEMVLECAKSDEDLVIEYCQDGFKQKDSWCLVNYFEISEEKWRLLKDS